MNVETALEYMWNKYGVAMMVVLFVLFYVLSIGTHFKKENSPVAITQEQVSNNCPPQVVLEN